MTTHYLPTGGGTIADLDAPDAADRKLDTDWTAGYPYAAIVLHNATDSVVYVTTSANATVSGRGIPAGTTLILGPYRRGIDLWVYGLGIGDVYYGYELVASEG